MDSQGRRLMPRIFDNIDVPLLNTLRETIQISKRGEFCVGYFSLRGWQLIDDLIENWCAENGKSPCRVLVGMQSVPREMLNKIVSNGEEDIEPVDQKTAIALKKAIAEEFRNQLIKGVPSEKDEKGLKVLCRQLKEKKVTVKLFLRHPLHAKLYLLHRNDPNNPNVGFMGSSNLSVSGLSKQGELNIDVLDHDACEKLGRWFEDRWDDRLCIDISEELIEIIENSWVEQNDISPYEIYVKIAYHLSQEARNGMAEFQIPAEFGDKLFAYQSAAVKIAAKYLSKRKGVLIGDVVGLGKTMIATAVAKIFQDDHGLEPLIICPKNLVPMWKDYASKYGVRAEVVSLSKAIGVLPTLKRYRLIVLDESHNLRNSEGKRYTAIRDYIKENDSRCVLLSATPYNRSTSDLSAQLKMFLDENQDLGIRPEQKIKEMGETDFIKKFQCSLRSLAAFEQSDSIDDWQDLMKLFLVRRTRSFIKQYYAGTDENTGRKFLKLENGSRSYFPNRIPKTVKFNADDTKVFNQYNFLYSDEVVEILQHLDLPRYGIGAFVKSNLNASLSSSELGIVSNLAKAGKQLMGVCRTSLFKRLESSGPAFISSLRRHILRNYIYLFSINNRLPIPIGSQNADFFDDSRADSDVDFLTQVDEDFFFRESVEFEELVSVTDFIKYAEKTYKKYKTKAKDQFEWITSEIFEDELKLKLESDSAKLISILVKCGEWKPDQDAKLNALDNLITRVHPGQKMIIFTQFADTVEYLKTQLANRQIKRVFGVTGESDDPAGIAWRFSPKSNDKIIDDDDDIIDILISTDVLSEGVNLQDSSIIVNYDLPWAIIRLIQRAGRVDRVGQLSPEILCYSFLPADGVERVLALRDRVSARLSENAQVIGTDEIFFEDERIRTALIDLYNEKKGILDDEDDYDVDLSSKALQVWNSAVALDPSLLEKIPKLPLVCSSAKTFNPSDGKPEGILLYLSTQEGIQTLAWVDKNGKSVTQSQYKIFEIAACTPDAKPQSRSSDHYDLLRSGVSAAVEQINNLKGQLGRSTGPRFRTYERLKQFRNTIGEKRDLFITDGFVRQLDKCIDEIYQSQLRPSATDLLNRHLKSSMNEESFVSLVLALFNEDRLCIKNKIEDKTDVQIICSLGLISANEVTR